jgi:hypothetical protein
MATPRKKTERAAPAPLIQLRPYQQEGFRHPAGLLAYLYRRQCGKSFGLACIATDWMMETPGCLVIFASASLRLGQENIRKEAEVWREVTAKLRALAAAGGARMTTSADDDKGELLDADAVADLFEHQKLETRVYHDRTTFSRSICVAPNPETAVGWTGYVILDEVGRIPDFGEVFEAMEPIISSQRGFRIRMATTPPPDDAHPSYELLSPQPDAVFPVNPKGNWYQSTAGILVHRVDAWDGAAAGVALYDLQSREPMTPEQHRAASVDKTAWDRNYGLKFLRGGSAAVSLSALYNSQATGAALGFHGVQVSEQLEMAA